MVCLTCSNSMQNKAFHCTFAHVTTINQNLTPIEPNSSVITLWLLQILELKIRCFILLLKFNVQVDHRFSSSWWSRTTFNLETFWEHSWNPRLKMWRVGWVRRPILTSSGLLQPIGGSNLSPAAGAVEIRPSQIWQIWLYRPISRPLGGLGGTFRYRWPPLWGRDICCADKMNNPERLWKPGCRKVGGGPLLQIFCHLCFKFAESGAQFTPLLTVKNDAHLTRTQLRDWHLNLYLKLGWFFMLKMLTMILIAVRSCWSWVS